METYWPSMRNFVQFLVCNMDISTTRTASGRSKGGWTVPTNSQSQFSTVGKQSSQNQIASWI